MTGSVVGPPSPVKSTIRTVGFPLSSSVNRTDPNKGDVQFMVVEVKCGDYLFRPPESLMERKNRQMAELPAEVGDDVTKQAAVLGTDRTFHYNPLLDYESVWWIAVWFFFWCRPEGTTDEET